MLNQILICGRLTHDPEIKELEDGKKMAYVTVAVPRSFKNVDGNYDTDFIRCTLWNGMAETTCEYCKNCKKGDVVGIKGRLQTSNYEKDGDKVYAMDVIAEKVSFLSSGRKENE